MKKVRTTIQLQELLDRDFAWRLKEIATLRSSVRSSEIISQQTAVRAALTLLYAHWEGFVKASSTYYLSFVNSRSLSYEELRSCFVVFGVKGKLQELEASWNFDKLLLALDFVRDEMQNTSRLNIESAIQTGANLNSTRFSNIATSIGIDTRWYEPKYNLIDESLLKRRNSIAHGEYLDIDSDGFRNLAEEVLQMLRAYKTDIENAVVCESYRRRITSA